MSNRNIVLLGNTGNGKSSTGNTILGKNLFTVLASPTSVTDEVVKKYAMVSERKITVIDTPGFDTDCDEMTNSKILKALIECTPGVDAFVMVLKVGRYTRNENEVLQKLLNTFSKEEVLKHTVILFTFGQELEGQSIEEFVKKSPKLQELVDQCGGRCHVIDNKYWNNNQSGDKSNRVQVKNLLDTIDEMVKMNGLYSNELLKMVEKEVQEEMKKIKDKKLTSEEKLEKAKGNVCNRWLQAVGAFTGFLYGALLGLRDAKDFILLIIKTFNEYVLLKPLAVGAVGAVGAAGTRGAIAVAGAAGTRGAIAVAGAGKATATATAGLFFISAITGGLRGAVTGWKAAEEADSVYDAMIKATEVDIENAKSVIDKLKGTVLLNPL